MLTAVHSTPAQSPAKIAIFHPSDPFAHIPAGIDSVIRGILKWAPADLSYTLFGATSDLAARPIGKPVTARLGTHDIHCVPIVFVDPTSKRSRWPLTLRYMTALRGYRGGGQLGGFDVLDFHRIEPLGLFRNDARPKNVVIHQDMASLRNQKSDIMWRHAPWLYEAIEKRLLRTADRVFCVRQSAVDRYLSLDASLRGRVSFIPTWVDTSVFGRAEASQQSVEQVRREAAGTNDLAKDAKLLVSVGRLDHQKDPLLLLQAFRCLLRRRPETYLVMVGDGSLRPQVERACATDDQLKQRVRLLGVRSGAEIARLMAAGDLFVLASAYEGMPIVVLEALATGLPVMSTDVGEVRLAVHDGINGRIAAQRTAQCIADGMHQALGELERLRGTPCASAVERFTPALVLERIYENHRRQAARSPIRAYGQRACR